MNPQISFLYFVKYLLTWRDNGFINVSLMNVTCKSTVQCHTHFTRHSISIIKKGLYICTLCQHAARAATVTMCLACVLVCCYWRDAAFGSVSWYRLASIECKSIDCTHNGRHHHLFLLTTTTLHRQYVLGCLVVGFIFLYCFNVISIFHMHDVIIFPSDNFPRSLSNVVLKKQYYFF